MKIGVAGAGLLGRLLAYLLSRQGHEIHIHDPAAGPLARGAAGWTAAGMLSPTAELESADLNVFRHGLRSIELWADLLPRLRGPADFHRAGSLLLAYRHDIGSAQRMISLLRKRPPKSTAPRP